MNIGSRIAAWQSGKKPPYARRLAYLETRFNPKTWDEKGGAYIYTGINPEEGIRWELDAEMPANSYRVIALNGRYANGHRFDIGVGDSFVNLNCETSNRFEIPNANKRHTFFVDTHNDILGYDDVILRNTVSKVIKTTGLYNDLYIFGRGNNDVVGYLGSRKIWSSKIFFKGNLIQSLIPVMSYEGNPEMYDEVSGTFAERHGDFLYGELDGGGGYKCIRRFSSRSTRRLRTFRAMRSRNFWKEVA